MRNEVIKSILEKYGDQATDSAFERYLYSRDLAPVPSLLVAPLFSTLPDIVVRPANTAEVADIMKTAFQNNVPVTPRAGGSTVYFDSVPVKKGILMDLNLLKGVVGIDRDTMTVTVKAGTTWSELEQHLQPHQLAAKSYPSSAPAATIGGWFCMMGYGIGSLKYGSFPAQVHSIEVVTPEGKIVTLTQDSKPSLTRYAQSEGTLGIITQLEIEVRPLTEMKHFLLHLPTPVKMLDTMHSLIKGPEVPYNMHFTDQACLKTMKGLGMAPANIDNGYLVGVDYEGSAEALQQAQVIVDQLTADGTVRPVDESTANHEWRERFLAMKLKRGGPSVLGAEIWLPIKNLPQYLADVEKMSQSYKLNLFSYGHVVTPEYATVMTTFFADETHTIKYIINLSLVKKIHDIGHRHGGHPYGVGLWNSPMIGRIHKASHLENLRARKKAVDPAGIMNPGKVYEAPLMLNPFNYAVGMSALAAVRKLFGKGW